MNKKIKVVFVCMGNICRSPTAHASFRALVAEQNLADKILVDSAGTHAYHVGEPPDTRAQQVALTKGMPMADLRARKFSAADLDEFDYILVMDRDNLNLVKTMANAYNTNKIELFLQYANRDWGTNEIPDPYYGEDYGFQQVFNMIADAGQGLLEAIKQDL